MKPRRRFTPSQTLFLWVVLTLCLIVLGSIFLSRYRNASGLGAGQALTDLTAPKPASTSTKGQYYATPSVAPQSFVFDPNEADSTQLLSLGLAPYQVRSIYRYRARGGRFSTKDDFRRVYRLTNEQWEHLSPLIRISRKYQLVDLPPAGDPRLASSRPSSPRTSSPSSDTLSAGTDTLSTASSAPARRYPEKLSGSETLDLNLADSAQLCRVPGIGPYFSRRILQYRRRLGGYVSTAQLLQIQDFPADAIAWLEVADTTTLKRLQLNRLSTRQLMKHPYMGYYRASEIASYRRIHGPIRSIDVLRGMPHFSEQDIERLAPYLSFD